MEYIAGKFMSEIPVLQDSGNYFVYNNDFRIPETFRANGTPANMATYDVSISSYNVQRHSLKDVVTDEDRDNTDTPIQLDRDMTEYLTDKLLLRYEYETAKLLYTTTTFGANATLNTATSWNYNTTTSAPIQNVLSATSYIISHSGLKANTMILGLGGYESLRENPNVYGRIQYVERAILTEDLLAAIFDLQNVYVGRSIYNQGKEGATDSLTVIWGPDALIAYFNPSMGRKAATAATTFRVTKYGMPNLVKRWRDEEVEGDYIEVSSKFGVKAVATSAAFLFKTVNSKMS
jgi:hypothetical protein